MSGDEHKPIIPLTQGEIGGETIPTVDGRTLHAFLEVGKDFTTWMKDRISQYGFEEGRDYVTETRSPELGSGNRGARTEFHLTLDMAKEMAMVERNAKGKEARLYFLECERIAKGKPASVNVRDPKQLTSIAIQLIEVNEELQARVAKLQPKADALDRIATADGSLNITEAAKALQMRPKDLFDRLKASGWIYKRPGGKSWLGYQNRVQTGLLEHKVTTVSRPDGSEKIVEQVLVTPKGLSKLAQPGLGEMH